VTGQQSQNTVLIGRQRPLDVSAVSNATSSDELSFGTVPVGSALFCEALLAPVVPVAAWGNPEELGRAKDITDCASKASLRTALGRVVLPDGGILPDQTTSRRSANFARRFAVSVASVIGVHRLRHLALAANFLAGLCRHAAEFFDVAVAYVTARTANPFGHVSLSPRKLGPHFLLLACAASERHVFGSVSSAILAQTNCAKSNKRINLGSKGGGAI
jgi:hypothetical protein